MMPCSGMGPGETTALIRLRHTGSVCQCRKSDQIRESWRVPDLPGNNGTESVRLNDQERSVLTGSVYVG